MSLTIFADGVWQMAWGERAAIEGMLAQVKPALALEIGTAEGACLARLAEWSQEVHSFDLTPPTLPVPANATLHTGDSHELLPRFLAELAEQGRNVDLVVVDGDHSPEGVRQDLMDLLDSGALRHTAILIHDTANARVREGLDATPFAAWPKVAHVDLDWIPGRLFAQRELRHELWYGLGLVLVDSGNLASVTGSPYEARYFPAAGLLREAREAVLCRELAPAAPGEDQPSQLRRRLLQQVRETGIVRDREFELQIRVQSLEHRLAESEMRRERGERVLADVMGSASWKATKPLRLAKRAGRRGGMDAE